MQKKRGRGRAIPGRKDEDSEDYPYIDDEWRGVGQIIDEPAQGSGGAEESRAARPRRSGRIRAKVRVEDEKVAEAERKVAELDEQLAAVRRKRLRDQQRNLITDTAHTNTHPTSRHRLASALGAFHPQLRQGDSMRGWKGR